MLGEVSAALNRSELSVSDAPVPASQLAGLLQRVQDGTITAKAAKDVFDAMWAGPGFAVGHAAGTSTATGVADAIIAAKGLKQITDEGVVAKIVDEVLAANPSIVAEFKAGKGKAFNSLVGKAIQATKGKANPTQVNALLKAKLGG